MNTAKYIKEVPNFNGVAKLYKLSKPVFYTEGFDEPEKPTEYVIASAVVALSGPETYLFPSNKEGEVLNWTELEGSQKGTLHHAEALTAAGYKET